MTDTERNIPLTALFLIGKLIAVVNGKSTKVSLHRPKTHIPLGDLFEYLPDILKKMEKIVAMYKARCRTEIIPWQTTFTSRIPTVYLLNDKSLVLGASNS
jgi:hypothetical protein